MKFNTKAIHAGQHPEETSGAVMPPIFQTSTFAQESPGNHKGYEYARVHNPTRTALEKLLAGLEGSAEAVAFASGLAAMDAILKGLRPGDHVIASNDLYGGTYRLFTQVYEPFGLKFDFLDMTKTELVAAAITPQTRMIWIETPTNPLLNIVDIKAVCALADGTSIKTFVDNTFASPYLQQPLSLGAHAVVHSTTKYLGGHSDVIGGAVCTDDAEILENLRFQVKASGGVPGPMDCYLTLRGIKTLSVRVQRSCENAHKIASWLNDDARVAEVRFPGLPNHPGHNIAAAQMRDFGGMVSFSLKDDRTEAAHEFMSRTRFFTLAESLGGVESLISHPSSMTHGSIPRELRYAAGLKDSLIRLSVGIEDADDLIADLDAAFAK